MRKVFKLFHSKGFTCKHAGEQQDKSTDRGHPNGAAFGPTAPLANVEDDDSHGKCCDSKHRGHQGKSAKGQTRKNHSAYYSAEDLGTMSEAETVCTSGTKAKLRTSASPAMKHLTLAYTNPAASRAASDGAVSAAYSLFLRHNNETKRVTVAEPIHCLESLKELFLNAFADSITYDYLHSNYVKVYIQDPGKDDLFYQLDDLNDVMDRSVLKLHEQTASVTAPSPSVSEMQSRLYANQPNESFERIESPELSSQSSGSHFGGQPADVGHHYPPGGHEKPTASCYNDAGDQDGDFRLRKSLSMGMCHYGFERYDVGRYANDKGMTTAPCVNHIGGGYYATINNNKNPQVAVAGRNRTSSSTNLTKGHMFPTAGRYPFMPTSPNSRKMPQCSAPTPDRRNGFYNFPCSDKGYSSEPSESLSRSGSVTPVIDDETRMRMANMERQLTNLSDFVHSALAAPIDGERKEQEKCRRSGAEVNLEASAQLAVGSQNESVRQQNCLAEIEAGHGKLATVDRHLVNLAKHDVRKLQMEMRNLRRMAEMNGQLSKRLIQDVMGRVDAAIMQMKPPSMQTTVSYGKATDEGSNTVLSERNWVDQQEKQFQECRKNLEHSMGQLEQEVNGLREEVVAGRRQLSMSTVEHFVDQLTQLTKSGATLKNEFPVLESRLRWLMSAEMEKVVREERFLKEEPARLNNLLKRSKQLSGTMVTMKRLAQVQNPSSVDSDAYGKPLLAPVSDDLRNATPNSCFPTVTVHPPDVTDAEILASRKETKTVNTDKDEEEQRGESHVLDSLLEELKSVAHLPVCSQAEPGNGEKRVGFAESVEQFHSVDDAIDMTTTQLDRTAGCQTLPANCGRAVELATQKQRSWFGAFGSDMLKKVASFHGADQKQKTKSSNSSVEDVRFGETNRNGAAPPPPPRTSSKKVLFEHDSITKTSLYSNLKTLRPDRSFKWTHRGNLMHSLSSSAVPSQVQTIPMIHTSAVDDDPPRVMRSTSSSDSVNSQEEFVDYSSLKRNYGTPGRQQQRFNHAV